MNRLLLILILLSACDAVEPTPAPASRVYGSPSDETLVMDLQWVYARVTVDADYFRVYPHTFGDPPVLIRRRTQATKAELEAALDEVMEGLLLLDTYKDR